MKQSNGINHIIRQKSLDECMIAIDSDLEVRNTKKASVFDKFIPNEDGMSLNDGSQNQTKHVKLNFESKGSEDSNGKITEAVSKFYL